MKKRKDLKNPKKMILFYSIASMFNDIGANLIYPLWPFYITEILGIDKLFLGLIDGVGDLLLSLSKAFSGLYSDKIKKRKRFIWLGYFLPIIARIGYAFSKTWPFLLLFKSTDRAGKIRDPPRDAIVSEITKKKTRGRSFGIMEGFDKFGGVLGIALLIFIMFYFKAKINFTYLFLFAALFSVISLLIIWIFTPEYIKLGRTPESQNYIQYIRANLSNPKYRHFLFIASLMSIATFSYSFVLLLIKPILEQVVLFNFSFNTFSSVVAVSAIGFFVYNGSATFSSYNFGKISDRLGRKLSILMTNSVYIFTLLCMFLSLNYFSESVKPILLFLAFVGYGIYIGALNTVLITYVSEISNEEYKASGIGFFYMVFGIFALLASLIAGYLSMTYGFNHMIGFSMIAIILSSILLFLDGGD